MIAGIDYSVQASVCQETARSAAAELVTEILRVVPVGQHSTAVGQLSSGGQSQPLSFLELRHPVFPKIETWPISLFFYFR
jgi:hypothetical protein